MIKHHIYHFLKSISSERSSNSLWGSDVLQFSEFINPFCFITLLNSWYYWFIF